jgi:hypothetical protein
VSDGMTNLDVRLLPGAQRLVALHALALPQRESLCGAFWGALALQAAAGGASAAELDQDAVALASGTGILEQDDPSMRPPGSTPRMDYRLPIPVVADPHRSGTAISGLARAVAQLSGGALGGVPVRGSWSSEALLSVIELLDALPGPVTAIANVATAPLWHSHASFATALRYLEHGVDDGTGAEWQVGHFVGLLGRVTGPRGRLILVGDTYPELGSRGVYWQPVERVVDALERDGSGKGGLLLVVGAADAAALRDAVASTGLEVSFWDNGSVDLREGEHAR